MSERPAATLQDLDELLERLDADAALPLETRRHRDRGLGRRLREGDDAEFALAWLAERRAEQPAEAPLPPLRPLALLLALLGGWATATAVFFFDGGSRVNVVAVLAVFVGLQSLLLLAFGLAALPPAWMRRIPVAGALARLAAERSPARLVAWLVARLPGASRAGTARRLAELERRRARLDEALRWWLLALSQDMAVAFNAAACATALGLVVLTDLAFGWATTLATGDEAFHAFVEALATPWAAWLPAAVPDLELVSGSRYFRIDSGEADAALLTRWWPFVLAAMVCYGLLPRLAAGALAHWRLRAALGAGLQTLPEVRALAARMRSALVETEAAEPEPDDPPRARAAGAAGDDAVLPAPVVIVNWAQLPMGDGELATALGERFGFSGARVVAAGGARSLAEDEAAVAASADAGSVLLATKAWEPPLLELEDFLAALRAALQPAVPIAVAPLAVAGGVLAAPRERDLEQWRDAFGRAADPHLRLLRSHAEEKP